MFSGIDLVIFDMDGVVFDTERLGIEAWQKAGAHYGFSLSREIIVETIGLSSSDCKPVYVKHFGNSFPYEEIENLSSEIGKRQTESHGAPVKEGLFEFLECLKKKGKRIALATSTGRQRTRFLLSKAGIREYFETIVCGDDVEKKKPAPEVYLKVARNVAVTPQRCIVIEDSEYGIAPLMRRG